MKLVAGIDLSPVTEKVMAQVREIAPALDASVCLLHIADPEPDFVGMDVGPQIERDARAKELHKDHQEVQALADELRDLGVDATALLVQGPTVETLVREINKLDADMVVLGSHGKGMLSKLLMGSVSEGVVKQARCPVLIVPTHERD